MGTFGKCVWDGCTRHAEKESTGACRAHHVVLRDARCRQCQGALATRAEIQGGRCRRCLAARAA
jgi:hypothetical protein